MNRLASRLSKIIIGSILLSNFSATVYAYPVEQFPHAIQYFTPAQKGRVLGETQSYRRQSDMGPTFEERFLERQNQTRGQTQTDMTVEIPMTSSHITRAEFVKSIIEGMYPEGIPSTCFDQLSPSNYWRLFRDVPNGADYGPHLCKAMMMGFVSGYPDTSFRPLKPINFAEASKILTKVQGLATDSPDPNVEWYMPYVKVMKARRAFPPDIELDDYVTPDAMAFMVARVAR